MSEVDFLEETYVRITFIRMNICVTYDGFDLFLDNGEEG